LANSLEDTFAYGPLEAVPPQKLTDANTQLVIDFRKKPEVTSGWYWKKIFGMANISSHIKVDAHVNINGNSDCRRPKV